MTNKSLNPDWNSQSGGNRFKFLNKKSRARRVDVDVSHKVRTVGYLDGDTSVLLEGGEGGCFFQDELERCKQMNTTPPFKRFYYAVWPLVQSLAELLHHSAMVAAMLLKLIQDPATLGVAGEQLLQLLSVLARDLQSAFHPHFAPSKDVLAALLQGPAGDEPEAAGRVMRAVGYILKFNTRPLLADPAALRAYYAPLLGHRRDYVRRYAGDVRGGAAEAQAEGRARAAEPLEK
ncbi:hypothetical protein JKP88DRAFT_338867 [Tribonema minus]|uniref:Uncharacterized protein n=1 Tax=Tribonema minus TaxID=303371 RepID=A0A835YJ13_9STRA|nr:hypothetical protein JKP88DRAFT_338867 [Tribonema minus]